MNNKNLNLVLIHLEEFITHPDNEFITDTQRDAFYILADAIIKFDKKYTQYG